MCIAIVKTKDGIISDDILRTCFKNNPHGSGIAWTENNQLYIIKGIFNVDEFINTVRDVEQKADSNILIHCRISTSGLVDENNSHPHIVNDSLVLIHNGILDIDVPKNSTESDTVLFIKEYLKDLPKDFEYNKSIMRLIEDRIGSFNKFCFLNSNGDYFILNEKSGEWINGVWYSNDSYQPKLFTYTKSYKSYSMYDDIDYTYYDLYGVDRYEYLERHPIGKKRIKKIINQIENLSQLDFEMLGQYPVYNIETNQLEYNDDYNDLELYQYYLYEIDDDLQDLYEEYYFTVKEYDNV